MMAGSAKKHPYNPLVEQFSETMVLRPGVLDFGRASVDAIVIGMKRLFLLKQCTAGHSGGIEFVTVGH